MSLRKKLKPLSSTGWIQEDRNISYCQYIYLSSSIEPVLKHDLTHDLKIVYWDIKHLHKQYIEFTGLDKLNV